MFTSFISSANKINWENFNYEDYNTALTEEISKVRANLLAPKYDTILLKAAQYHGYYTASNELVGHYDTSNVMSKTCSDRIRMFLPSASIVSYYTLCELGSSNVIDDSYSREIICSFTFNKSIKTYRDLAVYVLSIYKTSPGHWQRVVYGNNNNNTSASERVAGFAGMIDGKVYSVILFYDDSYYHDNQKCFISLIDQMGEGIHNDAYDYVQLNNVAAKNNSTLKVLDIGGEKFEIKVSIDYINHIDEGLIDSNLRDRIDRDLQKRKSDYIKKAGF